MLAKHRHASDKTPRSNSADPALDESMHLAHDIAEQGEGENDVKPIVSIHGRDVHDDDLEPKHKRPRKAA